MPKKSIGGILDMSKYPVRKIAICGRARSGKDTVANYLEENYAFTKFAFADDMKQLLHKLFPHISDRPKPRRAYQVFGEGLRNLDLPGAEHVWIDACMRKVNAHIWWHSEVDNRGANVVITDLRMQLEYDYLRANGFTIIRVNSPEENRMTRAKLSGDDFTSTDLEHTTELDIEGFLVDAEIVNDGSLDDLKAQIDGLMAPIYGVN
jgi:dephospho-CoA kinase